MIDGVSVRPLRRIPDERGYIMHMLRMDDPEFDQFGEIYFSAVYPGVVKAWHLHKVMTLRYATVVGTVKLVLYDDREGSPTRGELQELFIGRENYQLVTIPPGVWNGFKGMSSPHAIVANCSTHPHNPARSTRIDPSDPLIPYDWGVRHE